MITKGNFTLFFSERDQFSNWFISEFEVKGVRFNCVEQFMMFCKAKLFGDELTAEKILAVAHPRDQKALGRSVAGYDDTVWCERRGRIVAHGCYAKFAQNPVLRDALLATGNTVLVEASPYDRIWGVGLAEHDPRVLDPRQWKGQNLLGVALIEVREKLVADLSAKTTTETDEQLLRSLALVPEFGISKVQRLCTWGYNRAARKVDELLLSGKIQQVGETPYQYRVCAPLAGDITSQAPNPKHE